MPGAKDTVGVVYVLEPVGGVVVGACDVVAAVGVAAAGALQEQELVRAGHGQHVHGHHVADGFLHAPSRDACMRGRGAGGGQACPHACTCTCERVLGCVSCSRQGAFGRVEEVGGGAAGGVGGRRASRGWRSCTCTTAAPLPPSHPPSLTHQRVLAKHLGVQGLRGGQRDVAIARGFGVAVRGARACSARKWGRGGAWVGVCGGGGG